MMALSMVLWMNYIVQSRHQSPKNYQEEEEEEEGKEEENE
jgi:hypothetical protein